MRKAAPARPALRLVTQSPRSQETVDVLREMLRAAEAGEIVGIAAVAMYPGRRYCFNASGLAHQSPTFTIGALAGFTAELTDRIRGIK